MAVFWRNRPVSIPGEAAFNSLGRQSQETKVRGKRPPNPYLTGVIGWGLSMQFPQETGNVTAAEQS